MPLPRALTWAPAAIVAVLVALAIPTAQLPTAPVAEPCCCPRPAQCHCPGHRDPAGQPDAVRPCGSKPGAVAPAPLARFIAPEVAEVVSPRQAAARPVIRLTQPHPSPGEDRLAAPA